MGGAVRRGHRARAAVPRRGVGRRRRRLPYAGPWKERAAYRHTVEDAIYLARGSTGRGIGRALLDALLRACAEAGVQQVVAVVADAGDPASKRLHARCGFREVGRLERVGFKHGRWVDTVLMQRSLVTASST